MTATSAEIEHAIEVFARGFCFTRSITHPYLAERIENSEQIPIDARIETLWALRDAPRRSGAYRNEEWIVRGAAPEKADRIVRENALGRYALCAIEADDAECKAVRSGYKALGYRLIGTEPLMIHRLTNVPHCTAGVRVERIRTREMAERLAKATGRRPLTPEHLSGGSPIRQYVALDDETPVGWVSSIAAGDATWVSNMYVKPENRRKGIARALLCRMLQEDRDAGAIASILLSSHIGSNLYPVVGYEQIGTLMAFTPGIRMPDRKR